MQEFVIDLTSVCVRTGTLQLPSKVLSRFAEGAMKVLAGGGEVDLEFTGPRTLSGLKPFFESQGLRANDRLRIEFGGPTDAWSLKVVAERRERTKAKEASADALDGARAANPGMSVAKAHASSSMVREVRRVRIEAQPQPPTQVEARREGSYLSSQGHRPSRWSSLSQPTSEQLAGGDEDEGLLTTVRVVRRSAAKDGRELHGAATDAHTVATAGAAPAQRQAAVAQPAVPPPMTVSDEEVAVANGTVRVPETIASEREESLPEVLGRRQPTAGGPGTNGARASTPGSKLHRFGIRFWSDRSVAQPLKEPEEDLISDEDVADTARGTRATNEEPVPFAEASLLQDEERTEDVPALAAVAAGASERQAFDVFLGGDVADPDTRPSAIWRRSARAASSSRSAAPPARVAAAPGGEPQERSALVEPTATRPGDPSSQALARGEVRVAPLRSAAEPVEGDGRPVGAPVAGMRVEDAMEMINRYLMRPQTPAIVQTRTLADELSIDLDLAELAMERLSEDRDRFNRIRPGAYMVRRGS